MTLARKFKAGDGARYEDNAVVKVGGAEATQTARVCGVRSKKSNRTEKSSRGNVGRRISLPWGTRATVRESSTEVHDARGRVLSFKTECAPDAFMAEEVRFAMLA